MLNGAGEGMWEYSMPLRVAGFELGHRMTVLRLASGEVMVHSPVELNEGLRREVAELGAVKWIVAPSRMHDLFLAEWMEAFPGAALCHSPGLRKGGISGERMVRLSDGSGRLFGPEVDCLVVGGMPRIEEVVFLHRPSRSLIVADLVFNLPRGTGFQKLMQKVNGIYGQTGPSRLFRICIGDKAAFRASLERICAWDFDRIIPGHGGKVTSEGKARLRQAFAWLPL